MLRHVLTHPESRYLGIDCWERIYDEEFARRPIAAIKESLRYGERNYRQKIKQRLGSVKMEAKRAVAPFKTRATLFKGFVGDILIDEKWQTVFSPASLDAAYIDDDYSYEGVITSSVLIWPLIKPGGIVVWNNYHVPERPCPDVEGAVNAVLDGQDYEVLFSNGQFCVAKRVKQCTEVIPESTSQEPAAWHERWLPCVIEKASP